MIKCINVMLVDDHAVVRSGLRRLLEQNHDIEVVAEAESGEQAYRLYSETVADVVVMEFPCQAWVGWRHSGGFEHTTLRLGLSFFNA